jgi:UDP-N-acetyl-D-mannosaminuronate dehydrogenase
VPSLPEFSLQSTSLEQTLTDADLTIIVTAHPTIDHELVARRSRLVLDLRGVTHETSAGNVVRL